MMVVPAAQAGMRKLERKAERRGWIDGEPDDSMEGIVCLFADVDAGVPRSIGVDLARRVGGGSQAVVASCWRRRA